MSLMLSYPFCFRVFSVFRGFLVLAPAEGRSVLFVVSPPVVSGLSPGRHRRQVGITQFLIQSRKNVRDLSFQGGDITLYDIPDHI